MKRKYFIGFFIISFAITIIGSAVLADKVFAQEQETAGAANIQYPVKELGNCKNETACKSYCDKPENIEPCLDFAEKNNLMSEQEIEMAKRFAAAGDKGPGGCRGKDECENYCNDTSHINECIAFGEEHNLIPPEELAEAKKVQAAIARGVKPPPCGNKKQCDSYCEEPDHMEECISFGAEAGFIQGKELEDARKMLTALKKGVKPPPCKGKEACDEYCGNPDNMEVCMNFAIEAGFMSEQERAEAQKALGAIKKGIKPPNCRGREECDVYCGQEEHFEECVKFSEAAGFMSAEDAAMARKTKGKGPGNCKGKEECEAFCDNPDNQETCFNFAKEHGLISEENLKEMEEGKQKFRESLEQAPLEVLECLSALVGGENLEKFKSGAAMPSREIGEQMRTCYEKTMRPPSEMMPRGEREGEEGGERMTGPGGCKTPEECQSYCVSHAEECQDFRPNIQPQGQYNNPMPRENQNPPCEGESCHSGPLPGQPLRQPLEGNPLNTLMPGQPQNPADYEQQIIPPMPPAYQQPPSGEQPPVNQQPPQPLPENPPPPAENLPPPPSSAVNPESLLGSLLNLFLSLFKR